MTHQRSIFLVILTVALISNTPSVRADTQFYGLLSAGLVSGSGFSPSNESLSVISEQGHSSNRWGLRGSEELGQGLRMSFVLESSLSLRSGAAGRDNSSLFDREAQWTDDFAGVMGELQDPMGRSIYARMVYDF